MAKVVESNKLILFNYMIKNNNNKQVFFFKWSLWYGQKKLFTKKNQEDQFYNLMLNDVFEVKNLKGTKKTTRVSISNP
jgi:hypothetical protein